MSKKAFDKIAAGLTEALEFARADRPRRVRVHTAKVLYGHILHPRSIGISDDADAVRVKGGYRVQAWVFVPDEELAGSEGEE